MIVVVGAGVVGLSCAVRLAEAGFAVRVVSREPPPATTSGVAGAVWFPYLAAPRARVAEWAGATRRTLDELARQAPESGVRRLPMLVVSEPGGGAPPWWAAGLPEARAARVGELPPGCAAGHVATVAVAESPRYLPWLLARLHAAGGALLVQAAGVGSLAVAGAGAGLVVCCAGLGARDLAGDESVYPVRGQVVLLEPCALPRVVVDDRDPAAPIYVIPRRDDCLVGGTAEPGRWELAPDPLSTARILARARALVPQLDGVPLRAVRVGLRPARPTVRLELERPGAGPPIVHCYGHGGAGFTLSWGCADEVLALARQALG